ncbi:hypothetical protein PR202_gb23060 [Eleusine coracana subsp. coracana]|uniref:AP2/ERF domain-containing protein n=1 Tax=Eleusine coracana subsp. coracana TaxID=191504 RepID=A0AAV5FFB9_ELECO|nr:hypothetical protein PR202_gb23060 [Eleusine coracana subsp. coracana]
MCPIKNEMSGESSSPCSSTSSEHHQTVWTSPPKKPAGRTKFRETWHPLVGVESEYVCLLHSTSSHFGCNTVFRGVRRRGNAGRWVCKVRVPGRRGCRLWLGTFDTAEAAARAHDAAMLAITGAGACLNFADSAWLLAVPASFRNLEDVRHAVAEAVEEFQRREAIAEEDAASSSGHRRRGRQRERGVFSAGRGGFHVRAGRVRRHELGPVLRELGAVQITMDAPGFAETGVGYEYNWFPQD